MASQLPTLSPDELNRDRGLGALSADVIPRAVAIIFVVLRLFARRKSGAKLWWDDWLIIWVAVFFIPAIAVEGVMVGLGLGRHLQWVLMNKPQPSTLELYAKLAYFDQLAYAPMIGPIKCSILFLYLRIFGHSKPMWWACVAQIGLVVSWSLVTFFLFTFQCTPIEVAWSPTRAAGNCFQYSPLFIGTNTVNVVMDFCILVTPLPSIWQLKLGIEKKIWVTGILVLGTGGSIFSAVRLGALHDLKFIDVTWDHTDALIWSTVEPAVGVICACIPVLGPLLPRSCIERTGGSSRSTPYHQKSYPDRPSTFEKRNGIQASMNTGWSKMSRNRDGSSVSIDEHELVSKSDIDTMGSSHRGAEAHGIRQTVEWRVHSERRYNADTSYV